MDYGAALEMRFGETRRGFESRPLRHFTALPQCVHACVDPVRSSLTDVNVRSLRSSGDLLLLNARRPGFLE